MATMLYMLCCHDVRLKQNTTKQTKPMGTTTYKITSEHGKRVSPRHSSRTTTPQLRQHSLRISVMDQLTDHLESLKLDVNEQLDWLDNIHSQPPAQFLDREQLCDWIRTGSEELGQIRPYDYCPPTIVDRLVDTDNLSDRYSITHIDNAGKRINPFELVGRHFFSTRTSMKCANLDALLHFTNPLRPDGQPLVDKGEIFTYADVTNSEDVGIIEYIQWRKGRYADGYAFNYGEPGLLWRFATADTRPKSQLVQTIRGESTDPGVIRDFIASVRSQQPNGVHLAYSDRMDMPDMTTSIRENQVKRQVLSYSALCAALVRPQGTMIVKIMETLTPFTVGLIYLLRQCFAQMCLIKPISSRPHNSERYLMLRWRLPACETIVEHLLATNEALVSMASTGGDVLELVPADVIAADTDFVTYMRKINERMSGAQTRWLLERLSFLQDPKLTVDHERGIRLRVACLRHWNMPNSDDITRPEVFFKRCAPFRSVPFAGVNHNLSVFERAVDEFKY